MAIQIITHADVLRHTAMRIVVAVSLTIALTLASASARPIPASTPRLD